MSENTVFLSGPIAGIENYKELFAEAEKKLTEAGFVVLNPAWMPAKGFSFAAYMKISFAMLDACNYVVFLSGWEKSVGATEEYRRALIKKKRIRFLKEFYEGHMGSMNNAKC